MPDTVLGLVVLLASLGPGFVYVRVAESRGPRVPRSGLLEAVELVVIGAAASAITILAVALVAAAFDTVHLDALARSPRVYYRQHPLLVIGLAATALVVAYATAWGIARATYWSKPVTAAPGSTWYRILSYARPSKDHGVYATIELRDGRKVAGTVASFTLDEESLDREIALWQPVFQMPGQPKPQRLGMEDRFILLRERDILAISGQYYAATLVKPILRSLRSRATTKLKRVRDKARRKLPFGRLGSLESAASEPGDGHVRTPTDTLGGSEAASGGGV